MVQVFALQQQQKATNQWTWQGTCGKSARSSTGAQCPRMSMRRDTCCKWHCSRVSCSNRSTYVSCGSSQTSHSCQYQPSLMLHTRFSYMHYAHVLTYWPRSVHFTLSCTADTFLALQQWHNDLWPSQPKITATPGCLKASHARNLHFFWINTQKTYHIRQWRCVVSVTG